MQYLPMYLGTHVEFNTFQVGGVVIQREVSELTLFFYLGLFDYDSILQSVRLIHAKAVRGPRAPRQRNVQIYICSMYLVHGVLVADGNVEPFNLR